MEYKTIHRPKDGWKMAVNQETRGDKFLFLLARIIATIALGTMLLPFYIIKCYEGTYGRLGKSPETLHKASKRGRVHRGDRTL